VDVGEGDLHRDLLRLRRACTPSSGWNNIVEGSPEVVEILSARWDEMFGGTMEFIPITMR